MQRAFDSIEKKIKVTSLEIIVTGTKDKPYFEIKYKEVGKEDYHIGYSSYDLNKVLDWKERDFEIVNQVAEEYGGGWIPVSERLPEIKQEVLITADDNAVYQGVMANGGFIIFEDGWIDIKHVLAWRELPEPYKESEE